MVFSNWQCIRFGCKTESMLKINILPFLFRSPGSSVHPGQGLFSLAFGPETILNIIKPHTFRHNCQCRLQEGTETKKLKIRPRIHLEEKAEGSVKNASPACDYILWQPLTLFINDGPQWCSEEQPTFWMLNQPLSSLQDWVQNCSRTSVVRSFREEGIFVINVEGTNHLWYLVRSSSNNCHSHSKVIFPVTSPGHSKQAEACGLSREVKSDVCSSGLITGTTANTDFQIQGHVFISPNLPCAIPHLHQGAERAFVNRK